MTRNSVNGTLRRLYLLLAVVLLTLLAAKFADDIPGVPPIVVNIAGQLYEFMRDMSLLMATGGVAYLSNIFQKRSKFVESLEQEWRNIVRTKAALLTYCDKPYLATDDYLTAFNRISETIDTMRIVYRNAGETDQLVGLYPYAPLHDMRRALQTLDPRVAHEISPAQRQLVRDAITLSFNALRETFLEELDLEEPQHPLLVPGAHRLKIPGSAASAQVLFERQQRQLRREPAARPDVEELLVKLREIEREADGAADQTR